jgi:hypothetical protein
MLRTWPLLTPLAQEEKEMKDAIERNKKDWDAAIKLWEDSGNEAGTTLSRIFRDLKSKLEKDGNIGDFIKESTRRRADISRRLTRSTRSSSSSRTNVPGEIKRPTTR